MKQPLYRRLASLVGAVHRCEESGNAEWRKRHTDNIIALVREHMPSGSGLDAGTHLTIEDSTEEKLVFHTSFHHMNDGGVYDGWTEHDVRVTPSLASEFDLTVTGRNRNEIKDYIGELFHECLKTEVE